MNRKLGSKPLPSPKQEERWSETRLCRGTPRLLTREDRFVGGWLARERGVGCGGDGGKGASRGGGRGWRSGVCRLVSQRRGVGFCVGEERRVCNRSTILSRSPFACRFHARGRTAPWFLGGRGMMRMLRMIFFPVVFRKTRWAGDVNFFFFFFISFEGKRRVIGIRVLLIFATNLIGREKINLIEKR